MGFELFYLLCCSLNVIIWNDPGMCYELVISFVFDFVTASKNGYFKDEIISIEVKEKRQVKIVDSDEHPRADITVEAIKKLPPVFKKNGTVSAGNASVRTLKSITGLITFSNYFDFSSG